MAQTVWCLVDEPVMVIRDEHVPLASCEPTAPLVHGPGFVHAPLLTGFAVGVGASVGRSKPYPAIKKPWENARSEFVPFLDYDVLGCGLGT